MGQSYRIRTELGVNKTINVQLDQEFEQLEILSLKLQQEDVYNRSCADYGVIVGRVTANNGFGIPNARVSIFIPITNVDESNPLISSIYPYKSSTDKNEDGYRYNLLPYEKSYSVHAATGTFPSRLDALTGTTAVEIYDKYYKFTAKTNESGDYMIMGVPLGYQTVVMDVDLSDIGEFSLTPQDLIRMGLATEGQVAGNRFRTSNDINSLPQIINLVKSLEISPLWGEPDICDIAINRLDFDLRDDANVNIQPTSVFMGSIYSTPDSFRVRKNAKPKDDMGNLCTLTTGPGQILAIRQTIQQDTTGNPILEEYQLEQSGNIIDGTGVWLTELPMNLDYYITNEFGEKVISNDPTVGIPTKSKYRFKIKWQQPTSLTEQVRRPYFLVPNVREYGWSNSFQDPNSVATPSLNAKLAGSYYFGLDWTGYTNTQAAINCDDTFYQFEFNKVYTVSGLIDEFKNGGRGRFIGIKEIDSQDCESTINKFPVNEGFRNFDLIYFLFAIILQIVQIVGLILLIVYHVVAWIWDKIADLLDLEFRFSPFKLPMITYPDCQACDCGPIDIYQSIPDVPNPGLLSQVSNPSLYIENLIAYYEKNGSTNYEVNARWALMEAQAMAGRNSSPSLPNVFKTALSDQTIFPGNQNFGLPTTDSNGYLVVDGGKYYVSSDNLPIGERINIFNTRNKYFQGVNKIKVTFASDVNSTYHYDNTLTVLSTQDLEPGTLLSFVNPLTTKDPNYLWTGLTTNGATTLKGINGTIETNQFNLNVTYANPNNQNNELTTVYTIPPSETLPCVNSVTVDVTSLGDISYYDCNTLGVIYSATTLGIQTINDINCINIGSLGGTAEFTLISSGDTCQRYIFPSDIEYYQVLTAITITSSVVNGVTQYSVPNSGSVDGFWSGLLNKEVNLSAWRYLEDVNCTFSSAQNGWLKNGDFLKTQFQQLTTPYTRKPIDYFSNVTEQKILILQRGVDPYSPLFTNQYNVGKILGTNENDPNWTFTASTRLNTPIQKIVTTTTTSVQQHNNQNNIYSQSNFYTPGVVGSTTPGFQYSAYTTSNVGYYGALDSVPSNRIVIAPTGTYNSATYVDQTPTYPNSRKGVSTKTYNGYYLSTTSDLMYDSAEDLSGGAILTTNTPTYYDNIICVSCSLGFCDTHVGGYIAIVGQTYFSPILYPTLTGLNSLSITDSNKPIMRTDRLPSSSYIDTSDVNNNVSLLQQNLGFAVYRFNSFGNVDSIAGYSTGASQATVDIEGQLASVNVVETLSVCEKMVGLNCYTGNSVNFGVSTDCQNSDSVENGCYVFMVHPMDDLGKDLAAFGEWGYRFRFFYGLCRGVLSQTFTNNWINGSLYTFPIQVDTFFDSNNKPLPPKFVKELVYFDDKTNNFYYRSSPYFSGSTSQRFIGRPNTNQYGLPLVKPVNQRNLLFPTTIINLGIKDDFYDEIIFDPSAKGYIMNTLNSTSYSDTSDLVNLFVISRITDEGFLAQIVTAGNNGLNQLFTRPEKRIDGDLAQSMSINSEYGVIPFSPEFYSVYGVSTDPVVILGGLDNPTMGIFFSSTTVDLQNKDYLTPGVIDFRPSNNANAITYPYGIKSQYVPFYQWELSQPSTASIFGSEKNNWKTNQSQDINLSGIFGYNYQSLDRRNINSPTYFVNSNTTSDLYERGYIYNVDSNGNYAYSMAGVPSSRFLVSAPFHFYFGIIKGETALDKFKTKYSVGE
jgi:hypothetical protein